MGKYVDALTKWIPGDIVAFYLAAITLITGPPTTARPSVSLWLAAAAATALVVLAAALRAKRERADTMKRVGLGVFAFFVWSAVIPQSGWAGAWPWAAENPRIMTVAAGLVGLVAAPFADMFVGGD
ncbi:hypothetical protein BHQ19_13195 [Mycolicibacterium porcinum]|nr:hypothetical protein BHQ19_13195 [Mycolicibacterium porcinum]